MKGGGREYGSDSESDADSVEAYPPQSWALPVAPRTEDADTSHAFGSMEQIMAQQVEMMQALQMQMMQGLRTDGSSLPAEADDGIERYERRLQVFEERLGDLLACTENGPSAGGDARATSYAHEQEYVLEQRERERERRRRQKRREGGIRSGRHRHEAGEAATNARARESKARENYLVACERAVRVREEAALRSESRARRRIEAERARRLAEQEEARERYLLGLALQERLLSQARRHELFDGRNWRCPECGHNVASGQAVCAWCAEGRGAEAVGGGGGHSPAEMQDKAPLAWVVNLSAPAGGGPALRTSQPHTTSGATSKKGAKSGLSRAELAERRMRAAFQGTGPLERYERKRSPGGGGGGEAGESEDSGLSAAVDRLL